MNAPAHVRTVARGSPVIKSLMKVPCLPLDSLYTPTMSSPKRTPVALIGLGGVGKAVLGQLLSPPLSSKFRVAVIANSRKYAVLPAKTDPPLTPESCIDALAKGKDLDVPSIISTLSTLPDGPSIFVDSTASETIAQLYPTILQMNISVVTPNKKATSSALALYQGILSAQEKAGTRFYGESTVGAGLPILSTLKDLVDTGDEIVKIEGVFSGTLSYIFNEYSKAEESGAGVAFSDVVRVAKEQGYTEPDPRDDLSGTDVARKLCILARLLTPSGPGASSYNPHANLPLSALPEGYASIPTESLVPPVLQDCKSAEEYMSRLSEGDAHFDELKKDAALENMVVRYVGVIDVKAGKVECKLSKYPRDHAFATALKGSDNIVSFHTKRYSDRPLIVQGAGAGADVTAMGVTVSVLDKCEVLLLLTVCCPRPERPAQGARALTRQGLGWVVWILSQVPKQTQTTGSAKISA